MPPKKPDAKDKESKIKALKKLSLLEWNSVLETIGGSYADVLHNAVSSLSSQTGARKGKVSKKKKVVSVVMGDTVRIDDLYSRLYTSATQATATEFGKDAGKFLKALLKKEILGKDIDNENSVFKDHSPEQLDDAIKQSLQHFSHLSIMTKNNNLLVHFLRGRHHHLSFKASGCGNMKQHVQRLTELSKGTLSYRAVLWEVQFFELCLRFPRLLTIGLSFGEIRQHLSLIADMLDATDERRAFWQASAVVSNTLPEFRLELAQGTKVETGDDDFETYAEMDDGDSDKSGSSQGEEEEGDEEEEGASTATRFEAIPIYVSSPEPDEGPSRPLNRQTRINLRKDPTDMRDVADALPPQDK